MRASGNVCVGKGRKCLCRFSERDGVQQIVYGTEFVVVPVGIG